MAAEAWIVGAVVAALVALYTGSIASIISGLRQNLTDTKTDYDEKLVAIETRYLIQVEKIESEHEKKADKYEEELRKCHRERETAILWRARYEQRIHELERATLEGRVSAVPNAEGVLLIETVNVAVSRMFGYTRDELVGMPVEQLVSHEFRNKHLEKVQTHDPEIFGEFDRVINGGMGLRKDGTLFPVTVELKSVLINGKPGWAAIITLE